MGKAERQGYTSWDNLLEAGAVGEDILWSDDEIYRSCTLGELRKTIGTAFPIDLAVAYTLGSVGRDRGLTVDDMVNDYTRRATVLMSGKVGYGQMPIPEAQSCGHDMVDGVLYHFPRLGSIEPSLLKDRNRLCFTRQGITLKQQLLSAGWKALHGEVPEEVLKLTTFRVKKSHKRHYTSYQTLFSNTFKPLLDYLIGCGFDTLAEKQEDILLHSETTKGECGYTEEDVDESGVPLVCGYHSPSYEYNWWMIKDRSSSIGGVRQIWNTGKGNTTVSGYHRDQFSGSALLVDLFPDWTKNIEKSTIRGEDVIRFSTVARQLVNNLDDRVVKKEIRKSLNRMKNWSGRELLTYDLNGFPKRGKHTKYSWLNWEWLENVHTMAKYTNSKNRKIGDKVCTKCYSTGHTDEHGNGTCLDTCNEGWVYDKYDTYHIHGNEISKYRWLPIMGTVEGVGSPHVFCFDSWPHMKLVFPTAQELIFARKTFAAASNRLNGMQLNADWDASKNTRVEITDDDMKKVGFKIDKLVPHYNTWVQLPAEIHPEEFSTAWDLFLGSFNGSPEFFKEFEGLFEKKNENDNRVFRVRKTSSHYDTTWVRKPNIINVEETIGVISNE